MRNLRQNRKSKGGIHPSFLLLFLWFCITGNFYAFFIFVTVVLTHEFGHFLVAKKLGYKLDSFFLAPYGVSLNYRENTFENSDEIKIALAGPLVNLIFAFLCVGLWWIFPVSYNYSSIFVQQSFMLALFNLLPAYPMDGGRVLLASIGKFMTREKALKMIVILNLVFSLFFIALFIYSCTVNYNPTFALAAVFLLSGVVQSRFEGKYKIASLLKKNNKDFTRPLILYINSTVTLGKTLKTIQQNRYTIFYVNFDNKKTKILDENLILNLALKFPLSYTFNDIFNYSR